MATGKRYYWIKLKDSFMSSDTVDYLMSQPDGANYVVLYQMLCLKTINTGGKLSRQIGEIIIPYDVEKIQRDCKWFSADTIRVALNLYKAFGLIYEDRDGTLVLADHQSLVGSETDWAAKKRRQSQSQIVGTCEGLIEGQNGETGGENFPTEIRDKDNRDKEIKRLDNRYKDNRNIDTSAPQAEAVQCPYTKIKELYNQICISYPKIRAIEGKRKSAVAARWRVNPDLETFKELFTIAENSAFMKGQNSRNWSADFDWMMNPANFSKVLEHKYDKRDVKTNHDFAPTENLSDIEREFMKSYS